MRRWPSIVGSLLVLVTAAGCSGGGDAAPAAAPPPAGPSVPSTDYSTVDGQYRQIQVGLNLPKGVTFPAHLPSTGTSYPDDTGTVMAQNFWLCAWLRAYLAGTPGAADQVPKYSRMDAYTKALDSNGRAAVDGAIAGVTDGHKGPVTTFVDQSCGGPFYGATKP